MKKALTMIAALLSILTATAQNEVKQFSLKPFAGVSVSNLIGEDSENPDPRAGFHVGLEAEYQFAPKWSVSASALYTWGGCTEIDDGVNYTFKHDKIMIPIMLNWYVWRGLAISAGVAPAFQVNSQLRAHVPGHTETTSMSDLTRTVDVFIPLGVSYEFKNHLVLGMKWNFGLCNMFKGDIYQENGNKLTDYSVHHFTGMISLGYKFKL